MLLEWILLDSHYYLAEIYSTIGRYKDAADEWRKLVQWFHARGLDVEAEDAERELAQVKNKIIEYKTALTVFLNTC